jgi:multidrug efflux pump subunit AcrA (membrane-fusion protein)
VANAQNVVEQRTIQVGAISDDGIEILGGITDNELVVTSNLSRLKSGMTINPHLVTQDNGGGNQ